MCPTWTVSEDACGTLLLGASSAQLLQLIHGFESLGYIAVELRTHWHNQRLAAVARLGAKQDGVLRNHDL